jgi:ADP-ribosylglycohydrolase
MKNYPIINRVTPKKATELSLDRYLGSMFGLAIGDAFGAPIELNLPGTFKKVDNLVGGGYFKLKPGEWTDDTSLALCSADSLIRRKKFDSKDQLKTFLRWYREGYMSCKKEAFGIGLVTASALMRFESTHKSFCGPIGAKTATNGSIMHIAPIPLAYAKYPREAIKMSAQGSQLTHGAEEAVDACRYFSLLILGALYGYDKSDFLKSGFDPVAPNVLKNKSLVHKINLIASGSFKKIKSPSINLKNYADAATTLHAALWAFYHTDTFESGLIKVVNLGWDADTMGAVYGQLAGAYYGFKKIPESWTKKVAKRDIIKNFATKIYKLAFEIKNV